MEDKKNAKKNTKKLIVYAVLLLLIIGMALGTGQILLLLIFGVLFLKSLIVFVLGLIKPANHRARSVTSASPMKRILKSWKVSCRSFWKLTEAFTAEDAARLQPDENGRKQRKQRKRGTKGCFSVWENL